jgi:hypothetical protein
MRDWRKEKIGAEAQASGFFYCFEYIQLILANPLLQGSCSKWAP